ncbi:MAG TPA: hypothetical protein VMD53_16910 [Rhizomicrobium sp.]|nr:hypothetical protein [Rhizomicrobium sp.]
MCWPGRVGPCARCGADHQARPIGPLTCSNHGLEDLHGIARVRFRVAVDGSGSELSCADVKALMEAEVAAWNESGKPN